MQVPVQRVKVQGKEAVFCTRNSYISIENVLKLLALVEIILTIFF
jgi:hypothetical protein